MTANYYAIQLVLLLPSLLNMDTLFLDANFQPLEA